MGGSAASNGAAAAAAADVVAARAAAAAGGGGGGGSASAGPRDTVAAPGVAAPAAPGPGAGASAGAGAAAAVWSSTATAVSGVGDAAAGTFCLEWEAAQHNLFQTANLFFAAAFLVPRSFKQSLLVLRGLLCVGFLLSALWAGIHVCSPDVFAWNAGLVLLNAAHSALLGARFLPPPLSPELADVYTRLFRPLRVSRKHFKELARCARLLRCAAGDTYAAEGATPADERLSVLLKGRMRVSCDDAHLHYITPHQFIDSPEWEANHSSSDDLFQVTITAEQECVYLCWNRLSLERVLRHRPLLKTVLDCIIGKDITQKLYALNEQVHAASAGEAAARQGALRASRAADHWRRAMARSLSVDAVHTGARGHVRSLAWQQRRASSNSGSDREYTPNIHTPKGVAREADAGAVPAGGGQPLPRDVALRGLPPPLAAPAAAAAWREGPRRLRGRRQDAQGGQVRALTSAAGGAARLHVPAVRRRRLLSAPRRPTDRAQHTTRPAPAGGSAAQ
ncbi:blood vessel epicardial substance-like [Schistocerca cancellata]|uniref:blood vessel epicardial substance-like n=1 Tax=Schistocerca cancellata TaxID=274614 RepID=UPI002119AB46|nr:blood vessel epicardial substance-like [Schistocerca cancellata]